MTVVCGWNWSIDEAEITSADVSQTTLDGVRWNCSPQIIKAIRWFYCHHLLSSPVISLSRSPDVAHRLTINDRPLTAAVQKKPVMHINSVRQHRSATRSIQTPSWLVGHWSRNARQLMCISDRILARRGRSSVRGALPDPRVALIGEIDHDRV